MRAPAAFVAAAAIMAGVAGAATPSNPIPATVVTSLRATLTTQVGVEELAWQAPERFASQPVRGTPLYGRIVVRDGTFYASFADAPTSIFRRTFPVRPDGYPEIERVRGASDYVLGAQRGGRQVLFPATLGGRPAYRSKLSLHANDCAGLRSGSEELWLDRETLLPLKIVERRTGRGVYRSYRLVYGELNRPSAAAFAPLPPKSNPNRVDEGFVRSTPTQAARHLAYRPSVPETVADGFALAVSGWSRWSRVTGAEGSNPRYRDFFGAVYMRGVERLDLTERLAGKTGWIDDPFGAECIFESVEPVQIGAVKGSFGAGPQTTPHLYWRSGRILYSLSGPLSKAALIAAARSLAPV